MISDVMVFLNSFSMPVNFVCHLIIFIGAFYVALHNRKIPQWIVTPLWYLGLSSLLICITVLVGYFIGAEHPLSYWNMGMVTEYVSNIILAVISILFFISTVLKDLEGSKKRNNSVKQI